MVTQKRPQIGFQYKLSLNAGQKYCRMVPAREHSIILSTFIKLPFAIKIFVLSIFERPFYTGFIVYLNYFFLFLNHTYMYVILEVTYVKMIQLF